MPRWAVVLFALSAAPIASASEQPEPDCAARPLPSGCVTAIKTIPPEAMEQSRDPVTGTVTTRWYPTGEGATETLAAPLPLDQALEQAASRSQTVDPPPNPAPGASDPQANPASRAQSGKRMRTTAKTSQTYSTYCVASIYAPQILHGGWVPTHYARAHASQFCISNTISGHGIDVQLKRLWGGQWFTLAYDSDVALAGYGLDVYARYDCNHDGVYTYRSQAWHYATIGSLVIIGPQGWTSDANHTCPT